LYFLYIFDFLKQTPSDLIENFIQIWWSEPPPVTQPLLHPDTNHPASLREVVPKPNIMCIDSTVTISLSYRDRVLSITDHKQYSRPTARQSTKKQQSIEDWLLWIKSTSIKPNLT
jgi:hypothetical protein